MRLYFILYRLTFFAGCVILLVGSYMKYRDLVSQAYQPFGRYAARMPLEALDGNGTILLGVVVLLLSWWAYGTFESRRAERKKRIADEKAPSNKKENRYWSIAPQRKRRPMV